MTREEYAEVRDIFVDALNALEDAQEVFYELAMDRNIDIKPDPDEDLFGTPNLGWQMDEAGLWIGKELNDLERTSETLYSLVGKAHQRAVPRS